MSHAKKSREKLVVFLVHAPEFFFLSVDPPCFELGVDAKYAWDWAVVLVLLIVNVLIIFLFIFNDGSLPRNPSSD